MLNNKKILLGICGGIAAYKCAHLVRLLKKQNASVKVIMSPSAIEFITPKTLGVLSNEVVITEFFDSNNTWNNHVHLAEWADVFLMAPLTANSLAKMVSGVCDNVLMATYFSSRTKVIVAPAMDLEMYQHETVKENLEKLKQREHLVIPAERGFLASGLEGEGRMAEPENILKFVENYFLSIAPLQNKTALITAGPTHEAIDPVRFIGNKSSGKMGIAIAENLANKGAEVTLVLGATELTSQHPKIKIIKAESAEEMFNAAILNFNNKDIVVCAAAVADYRPENSSQQKIKKTDSTLQLTLVKTKDILKTLGEKKQNQLLVGFALETENLIENAKGKLIAKNLDLIIANHAIQANAGIGYDNNKIAIIDKHNKIFNFELKNKIEIANDIVNLIQEKLNEKSA